MTIQLINILYVEPTLQLGGANISLIDLMVSLDSDRFIPIALCPREGAFSDLCHKNGVNVVYLPSIPIYGGKPFDFLLRSFPIALSISKIIQRLNIKIIHSNTWRVAYYSGLAARLRKIHSVTHVRDYQESYRSWLKYWSFGSVSDIIITESQAVEASIHKHTPKLDRKISTIYYGLPDFPKFTADQKRDFRTQLKLSDNFPSMAVVGSISALKGQEIAIKALPQILPRFPKAKLLLVGEPLSKLQEQYYQKLIKLIRQLGLESSIVFTGFRKDIMLLLASIDILIHPPTLPDAFPHILLEAGAQKALVVASKIGGISEIIEDGINGCLVPPKDPESLAKSILYLLDNPELSNGMREAIYKRVTEQFTFSRHVEQIEALYEKLLDSKK